MSIVEKIIEDLKNAKEFLIQLYPEYERRINQTNVVITPYEGFLIRRSTEEKEALEKTLQYSGLLFDQKLETIIIDPRLYRVHQKGENIIREKILNNQFLQHNFEKVKNAIRDYHHIDINLNLEEYVEYNIIELFNIDILDVHEYSHAIDFWKWSSAMSKENSLKEEAGLEYFAKSVELFYLTRKFGNIDIRKYLDRVYMDLLLAYCVSISSLDQQTIHNLSKTYLPHFVAVLYLREKPYFDKSLLRIHPAERIEEDFWRREEQRIYKLNKKVCKKLN